jgi:SAM-dependent methyltransferase
MKKRIYKTKVFSWITKKLSQEDIKKFCEQNQTTESESVLIVHSDDMHYPELFPKRTLANVDNLPGVTVRAEPYYYHIYDTDDKYDVVMCTGLLEHVPEPSKTIVELHRVLKPGGKLLISASTSFSIHNSPENYFQFTEFGMEYLFRGDVWKNVQITPACGPFRTLGILLQRICYQSKMNWFLKIFFFLVAKVLPWFDKCLHVQYGGIRKKYKVRSLLYSNVQVVATKA